jgi:hypothetical protein
LNFCSKKDFVAKRFLEMLDPLVNRTRLLHDRCAQVDHKNDPMAIGNILNRIPEQHSEAMRIAYDLFHLVLFKRHQTWI